MKLPSLFIGLVASVFVSLLFSSPAYAVGQQCAVDGSAPRCPTGEHCGAPVIRTSNYSTCVAGPAPATTQNPANTTPTPTPTQTQTNSPGAGVSGGGATLANPLTASTLPELLLVVLGAVVQLGSIVLVLALVYVGFLFVAAQGSEEKIRDARGALVWTVIGGLILLGAQVIASVIQATVNAL